MREVYGKIIELLNIKRRWRKCGGVEKERKIVKNNQSV